MTTRFSPDSKFLYLAQRVGLFRDLLRDRKLDGFFLTHLSDQFYFTDYKSEGYFGLIGLDDAWLFLPNLLYEQGRDQTRGFHCLKGRLFPLLQEIMEKKKLKKIAFDPNQCPYSLGAHLMKLGMTPVPGLVAKLRAIKDDYELQRLRTANHIAALGANFIQKRLKPGKTEKQASAELSYFFEKNANGVAFDLIIAAGPHSAFPHHINTDYKMKAGEPVICDIGATWKGYRSDLTRTFTLGKVSPYFLRVFKIVEKAQKEGISRVKPGVTAGSVDAASRRVIKKQGFGPTFVHSTGHGVGIDIHEDPRIGPGAKDVLKAGMVVTVEPGIYLPGKFGVRIEDTLLVTPSGSELLTQ
jgi:Xaa-Pro aminopeptidase